MTTSSTNGPRTHNQGFKDYFALGFFQGALLKDPKKLPVRLGQTQAGRVMKFSSVREITSHETTIKAYVELKEMFRKQPRLRRAFAAFTAGRQRSYLYHFAGAKQSATRIARIEKAMPRIFAGMGFLERPKR
jgi:uncharacterized protein YdeI (YjbR/CyaY-like superfamily)